MSSAREAVDRVVSGMSSVTPEYVVIHLRSMAGIVATRTTASRYLRDLGWEARHERNGARVYYRGRRALPTAPPRENPLCALRTLGIRLETACATLTGAAERGDAAAIDVAIENRDHARDAVRAELESVTGIPVSLIERWLSL